MTAKLDIWYLVRILCPISRTKVEGFYILLFRFQPFPLSNSLRQKPRDSRASAIKIRLVAC